MEQFVFNTMLAAFVVFHRAFGLLVMICLLLWLMSGRRLDPGAYTTSFLKACCFVYKNLMKAAEGAAKATAARVPVSHASWRPLVLLGSQICYSCLTVLTLMCLSLIHI